MELTEPILLDQLPPEMIELLALYLPCDSIKALKCVNKYLNTSLDTSRVWKRLLLYPERYYKSDIMSESQTAAVVEVVEEISGGNLGRLEGYYKLQRARQSQWQNKQCEGSVFVDIVNPFGPLHVEEMVDDFGQRWFFILSDDAKLHIWNITNTLRLHEVVQVSSGAYSISLLHQGYVMVYPDTMSGNNNIISVYKFGNPDYALLLWYQFVYNEVAIRDPTTPLPTNECNSTSCVVNDLFIACDYEVPIQDLCKTGVHVWNVGSGRKLAKVSLPKFVAADVSSSRKPTCTVIVHDRQGYSSNILVSIEFGRIHHITVFNAKTLKFTCFLPSVDPTLWDTYVYGDIVCCCYDGQVVVYTLPAGPAQDELTTVQPLKTFQVPLCEPEIIFRGSKMMIRNDIGVLVVSLINNALPEVQVTVNTSNNPQGPNCKLHITAFIEPNFLIVWKNFGSGHKFMVIDTRTSATLNTWDTIDQVKVRCNDILYPSKFGVGFGNNIRFYAL